MRGLELLEETFLKKEKNKIENEMKFPSMVTDFELNKTLEQIKSHADELRMFEDFL